ncbi:MAG: SBBP repeat-containing protein [Ignavibacteria bacterium]|nr:SBBP repeat-containing protein [Ignavibacteria bacterium]
MKKLKMFFLVLLLNTGLFSQIPYNYFIKNYGQWDLPIKYAVFYPNLAFYVTNDAIYFNYFSNRKDGDSFSKVGDVIKFQIEGSVFQDFEEFKFSDWKLNFFYGNNPKKWIKNVQGYEKIKISNILPGIDLVLTCNEQPRYDFVVHPNANPENIKIKIEGAEILKCNSDEIVLVTSLGEIIHRNLFVYQDENQKISRVDASFKKINKNTFTFEIGNYDKQKELIVDPLVLSTLVGGSSSEEIVDLVEISQGIIVVTGWTESFNFITTPGSYSQSYKGEKDIFVSKFNVKGSKRELIFSTLIGGSSSESPTNVLVDDKNFIYIGALTNSNDLPLVNSMSKSSYGLQDAYICKFNSDCNELIFSTYFGGSKDDILTSVKLSGDNGIYLLGYTNSPDLPVTGGAYQGSLKGKNDIFFAKISNTGQAIRTCTYIGGIEDDFAYDMCVSPSEYVYIGGATKSNDFPAFPVRVYYYGSYEYILESPFDRTYNGNFDGVVIKILGSSGGLEYASFFGGIADDFVTTVWYYGTDEKVVFAGKTFKEPSSVTFPLTQTAYQNTIKGQEEAFVASLSNINTTTQYGWTYKSQNLVFSTFLGGSGTDVPKSIGFHKGTQNFYIVGYTSSTNFPIVNNPSGKKFLKNDIFFVSMLSDGSGISYSNILGGNEDDIPNKIFINYVGDYYIVGKTSSSNFPIVNPLKNVSSNSFPDGFILKNVEATLRFEAPFGNEEYCPGSSVQVKWGVEGITQPDSFDVEIRQDNSSEWILVANAIKGLSTNITIPNNIIGKVWIRVSHPKGMIATIQSPIIILEPPKLVSFNPLTEFIELCEGDSIVFNVSATGSRIKYQWLFNNQTIEGAIDSVLVLRKLLPVHSGKYKVTVSGVCPPKLESKEVTVEVIPKTKILSQTKDTIVKVNESLILYVQSEGRNLKYQWYKNDIKLLGEKNNTLKLTKVSSLDGGNYYCVVEGTCGSDTSKPIIVTIDTNVAKINFPISIETINIVCSGKTLFIRVPDNFENPILSVSLFDILGNKVFNQKSLLNEIGNEYEIDLSNLPNGIYFAFIQVGDNFRNIMFIRY